MKKTMKRILTLILALVVVMGLSAVAFAASSDPYLANLGDVVRRVTPGSSVNFSTTAAKYTSAGQGNSYLTITGFDSAADASAKVSWTIAEGSSRVFSVTPGTAEISVGEDTMYASTVNVTLANSASPGIVRVRATRTDAPTPIPTDCFLDFAILVDATTPYEAENVTVTIRDLDHNIDGGGTLTVKSVSQIANSSFTNSIYSFQNLPTAANVFDQLKANPTYTRVSSVAVAGSFIEAVTLLGVNNVPVECAFIYYDSGNYKTWEYGVVRDGDLVPESRTLSATAFELEDGDEVIWVYGYKADIDEYFEDLV